MNRKGDTVDWDNDDVSELKVVGEQSKLIHPGIIAEIHDVKTEDRNDSISVPILVDKEGKPPLYAEHAPTARKNADIDAIEQARGVNAQHYEVLLVDNDTDATILV